MFRYIALVGIVAALCSIAGCGDSGSGDDDHHMEHFVPEHKPPNFAAAVDDLKFRAEHLLVHVGEESDVVSREVEELADIVGWIPELAADSDLNEADWLEAKACSERMAAGFSRVSQLKKELGTVLATIQSEVAGLEVLVLRAGQPEPKMHDHEHGHHD